MKVQDYFDFIVKQVHSAVFATVDREGRPVTCAIDIMDYDESGLYFLTARGKDVYDRLKANEHVAFTAMRGEDPLSCVAVSVHGNAKEIGPDRLPELFRKNPYMEKIYPDVRSRSALTVFQIYAGSGEWFDLSKRPIERDSFSFGGAQAKETGYFVTDSVLAASCAIPNVRRNVLILRRSLWSSSRSTVCTAETALKPALQGPLNGGG